MAEARKRQGNLLFDQDRAGPLTGYRVIELASTAAGPFCGRLMADAGAEVIKVEPFTGDPIRTAGKQKNGKDLYSASLLRNKDSIAINLKSAEGQEIVKTLVKDAHVVIQNFLPGKLDDWGIGYKALSAINPALVMVSISGYGQTGPLRDKRGYGVICEAFSGLRHIIGDPDRPPRPHHHGDDRLYHRNLRRDERHDGAGQCQGYRQGTGNLSSPLRSRLQHVGAPCPKLRSARRHR